MSTRAQVRFATREEGVSFSEHPEKFHAQFYKHHDGYPSGLGVDLAKTLLNSGSWNAVPLEIDSLGASLLLLVSVLETPYASFFHR
jgi:hypothetical protein